MKHEKREKKMKQRRRIQNVGIVLVSLLFIGLFAFVATGKYKSLLPLSETNQASVPSTQAASTSLPFDMPTKEVLRASNKLVFAHYWTPIPISVDNKDGNITDPNATGADYITRNFTNPKPLSANEYKHAAYGGYLRDRPLPRAPINSTSVDTTTCPLPEPTGWRLEDAKTDVRNAIAAGLDGFTLNTIVPPGGGDYRNCQNGYLIMQAAQAVDPNFKVVVAPDMSGSLGTMSTEDLAAYTAQLASYKSAFRLPDGRLVFAPFYPEKYHDATWWANFFKVLKTNHNIDAAFVPVFLNYPANASSFASISYGFSNWGNRSPASNANLANNMNDAHAKGKIWMQPVSLQDVRPRSYIYDEAANTENLRATWNASIANADWVHIPTWNDFSENTHITPSKENGWTPLDLMSYYINKFKKIEPTIKRDAIYISHRSQLVSTTPSLYNSTYNGYTYNKLMTLRSGSTPARDTVEVLSFLTAPGDVTVKIGSNTYTYAAPAGLYAKTYPLAVGQVSASMSRSGQLVTDVVSPNKVESSPLVQDLQYKFASSLREGKTYATTPPPEPTPTPEPEPTPEPAPTTTPTIVKLTPTADTYANQGATADNYATSASLSSRGNLGANTFMRFNLPKLPSGQKLTGATLQYRTTTLSSAGSAEPHTIRPASNTWDESTVTWFNQPPIDNTKTLGTINASAADTQYTTNLSAAQLQPLLGSSTTLAINNAGTDSLWIWSSNHPATAYRPVLTLTFEPLTTSPAPDTTPPSAPTSLSATASAYNRVNLTWNASTDNVGITGYYVVRNGTTVATTTTPGYADTTVNASTQYTYQVIARDAANNTATSNSASVTTPKAPDTTAPSVPQNVVASAVSASQINVTWAASSDNTGVASYKIYRSGSLVATVGGSTLSYGNTGLSASTGYSYTVSACDAANNCSAQSKSSSATTKAVVTTGTLSGTVKDSSGKYLGRVKVRLNNGTNSFTTYTTTSGAYAYGQLPQGSYSATYSARSYKTLTTTVSISAGVQTFKNVTLSKR
jgi:chitodextrinase